MTKIPADKDEIEKDKEDASKETDKWESRWADYGELPSFIPDFNVALAKFVVQQTEVDESFPKIFRKEGGIQLFKRFSKVFI
jgi:hypothetical protein